MTSVNFEVTGDVIMARAIDDAPDPSVKPLWKFWGRRGREKQMASHINAELPTGDLVHLAFLMDVCLAEATGTTQLLLCRTLPDELKALEKVAAGMADKAELLTKSRDGLREAQESLNALCEMLNGIVCKSQADSTGLTVRRVGSTRARDTRK
ncbi:hypothetical protein SBA6_650011 [Candidatus Sulfopaludibacter sp. SbA6]|nr:hypothetical protein SBA6_650011 [Candidatus Sulfopaludibacter sp. SbA6]